MLKKTCIAPALLFLLAFASLSAAGVQDRPLHKPLAPVRVSIQAVRADLAQDSIQPGDVVELRIAAVSAVAAGEMRIDLRLEGGAKLVSGETDWKGQAAKDEEITLTVTVRAPDSGRGKVRAVVSLPATHGPRFSSEAQFDLGPGREPKPEQEPVTKKNSRGRSVIEYE